MLPHANIPHTVTNHSPVPNPDCTTKLYYKWLAGCSNFNYERHKISAKYNKKLTRLGTMNYLYVRNFEGSV